MDLWYSEDLHTLERAHITFDEDGGSLVFLCVNAGLACRTTADGVSFSFEGDDDGHDVSGLGSARLTGPGHLTGELRFLSGDVSGFVARRQQLDDGT